MIKKYKNRLYITPDNDKIGKRMWKIKYSKINKISSFGYYENRLKKRNSSQKQDETKGGCMSWLCKLGIHKKTVSFTPITKATTNCKEYCIRCNQVFDEYGMTHFHLGTFRISIDDTDKANQKGRMR